ncbi:MAG: hypothetical protein ACETWK_09065 [Candidatus Aminicenantaceae bacterium]
MKLLSYISLLAAGICVILAIISHFFFESRIVFAFTSYVTATRIFLLASIAFGILSLSAVKGK